MRAFHILVLLAVVSAHAEVWIAPGPIRAGTATVAGNGTVQNPYTGDFDLICSNCTATNVVLHLLPGTFWTRGNNLMFRNGERMLGSGIDITVIKRDHTVPRDGARTLVGGYCSRAEVANLTADVNSLPREQWAFNGIVLIGTNDIVRDVKVIHATGNGAASSECFPILISAAGAGTAATAHNIITRCEVSSLLGDYATAIALASSGEITFCKVELPPLTSCSPPTFHAYGGGCTVASCECWGGSAGWYMDGDWQTNAQCLHNRFYNVYAGVDIEMSFTGVDGLLVAGNIIQLNPVSTNRAYAAGIRLWGNDTLANATVSDNLIRGQSGQAGIYVGAGAHTPNLKIVNNTVSPGMVVHVASPSVVYSGNTDTTGAPAPYQYKD
jgi:hypothetical protein